MTAKIRNSFIAGLLVILPVVATYYILRFLVISMNNILLEPFLQFIKPYLGDQYLMIYAARALIFISVVILIMLIGAAVRIFFIKEILSIVEKIFSKLPLVGKVYKAMKQLTSALFGGQKDFFNAAVMIEYPRPGSYSIGFVTGVSPNEVLKKVNRKMKNVYVPTSPNPTSGYFLLIPEEDITYLNMTVEEALKLIISGGAVIPEETAREIQEHQTR